MKAAIREHLDRKYQEQQMPEGITLSKQELQELLTNAIKAATAMNPLQQKQYEEEMAKEERRKQMVVQIGQIEAEKQKARKLGCSHSRHPLSSGKMAGHACAKGQGEWTTAGQLTGAGGELASMICQRCGWVWQWKPTSQEREYISEAGMLGMAPPSDDRCTYQG